MKLILKNSQWSRSKSAVCLLEFVDGQRRQDCIGALLTQLGIPDERLLSTKEPADFESEVPVIAQLRAIPASKHKDAIEKGSHPFFRYRCHNLLGELVLANDCWPNRDKQLEMIADILAMVGVEVDYREDE